MDYLENRATSKPAICAGEELLARALGQADRMESLGLAQMAKKLRCCGRCRPRGPEGTLLGFPCNSKACPACGPFLTYQRREKLTNQVIAIFGLRPMFATFTLTPAPEPLIPLKDRITRIRTDFVRVRTRQSWKKRGSFVDTCGLVLGTEFTNGREGQGHPHLHGIVFGHNIEVTQAAAHWIVDAWLRISVGASPLAQEVAVGGQGSDADWRQALNYAVKGSMVRADWCDDFLLEAVEELTSGRHHVGSYGLLSKRRRRPSGLVGLPEVCLAVGNTGQETS